MCHVIQKDRFCYQLLLGRADVFDGHDEGVGGLQEEVAVQAAGRRGLVGPSGPEHAQAALNYADCEWTSKGQYRLKLS